MRRSVPDVTAGCLARAAGSAEKHHLRIASASECVMVTSDLTTSSSAGAPRRATVEPQLRRATRADHLDVLPQHARDRPVPSAFMAASLTANRPARGQRIRGAAYNRQSRRQ